MSQWGDTRSFVARGSWGEACMVALAHVVTDGFVPLTPEDIIDGVEAINLTGPSPHAHQLLQRVRDKYLGRPYREWLASGEMI
jgi:hypothetical protein